MSNHRAIAAATAALQKLLYDSKTGIVGGVDQDSDLADVEVTARPLHFARVGEEKNQVNICLFHTGVNGDLRNAMSSAGGGRMSFEDRPAVSINLYYFITAYGKGRDELVAQRLLGRSMQILADNARIPRSVIRDSLPGNNLFRESEPDLRITQIHVDVDEVSRMWTAFQTPLRLSVFYEVGVVLIDPARDARRALPVLKRPLTNGDAVQARIDTGPPRIDSVEGVVPGGVTLGDEVVLSGHGLERLGLGKAWRVELQSMATGRLQTLDVPEPNDGTTVRFRLPQASAETSDWNAGSYLVTLAVDQAWRSDPLQFGISTKLNTITHQKNSSGDTLAISLNLGVVPSQRIKVFAGDRSLTIDSPKTAPTAFKSDPKMKEGMFTKLIVNMPSGLHGKCLIRAVIDGVESIVIDRDASTPRFDPELEVDVS